MPLKFLALLLFPLAAIGQSAAVPAQVVPLPAVVDPGWTLQFSVPRNGGSVKLTLPSRTLLPASQTTTKAVAAPVTLSGSKFTFAIEFPPDAQIITNADGTRTITGATVTLTPVTP